MARTSKFLPCKSGTSDERRDKKVTLMCGKYVEHVPINTENGQETDIVPHPGPHTHEGMYWNDNGYSRTWTINGLWLTNGGQIVKPGAGECASELSHDIEIMTYEELQEGISLEAFQKRLEEAIERKNRVHLEDKDGRSLCGDYASINRTSVRSKVTCEKCIELKDTIKVNANIPEDQYDQEGYWPSFEEQLDYHDFPY